MLFDNITQINTFQILNKSSCNNLSTLLLYIEYNNYICKGKSKAVAERRQPAAVLCGYYYNFTNLS